MSKPVSSVVGRIYYFTIPEQRVIYHAIKMYMEKYPNNKEAQIIREDFYREKFE